MENRPTNDAPGGLVDNLALGKRQVSSSEGYPGDMTHANTTSFATADAVGEVFKCEVDVFYSEVISAVSVGSVAHDDKDTDDSSVAAVKMSRQASIPEEGTSLEDEECKSLAAVSMSAQTEKVANLSGLLNKDILPSLSSSSHTSTSMDLLTEGESPDPDYARLEHLAEPVIEARRIARLQRDQRRAELIRRHHPNYKKKQERMRFTFAGGMPRLEKYSSAASTSKAQKALVVIISIFFAITVGSLVFIVQAVKTRGNGGSALQESVNAPTDAPTVIPVEGSISIDTPRYIDPILASQLQKAVPTLSPIATGLLRGATSSSPVSCPELPSPPPFPGKKGAAMTLGALNEEGSWIENLPKLLKLDPHWNCNWNLRRIGAQPDDIEFVPMVWGGQFQGEELQANLMEFVLPHIENGNVKRLLAINEPDRAEQANLTVSQVLEMWPQLELLDLPLISPSCAKAEGSWMEEFMGNVTESCIRVDWVGVHWYGAPNFNNFKSTMLRLYENYGQRHLVLTEFAIADWNATTVEENIFTPEQVLDFMQLALPWMEQQVWIAGYVWFNFDVESPVGSSSALFDKDGQLTALGRYYASVRNESPLGDQDIAV